MRLPIPDGADDTLICPVCEQLGTNPEGDDDWVHIGGAKINAGGNITVVEPNGPFTYAAQPVGRGSHIAINFFCERGHTFTLTFHFHKGQTLVNTLRGEDHSDREFNDWPPDMWRD